MHIRSILLIISGSVAAYKSLELIRAFRKKGVEVDAILTKGGQQFITPLAVSSLTGNETFTDLFSLKDEVEMGHIQLSRKADAILVAPASADILAKMATGLCNDLATTALLATNKPVFIAPAMNHKMWSHPATQRNVAQLQADGITLIPPTNGEMACGETGEGRFAEVETIIEKIQQPTAAIQSSALQNRKILVTAGPTHEPIDPVRFLGNHSSGKQGIAIAKALADAGAQVELVLGPTAETPPSNVTTHRVMTAQQMLEKCQSLQPVNVAICTAAVADWKVERSTQKIKKQAGAPTPSLQLSENPDILKWLSQQATPRAELVVGFAAETETLNKNAQAKFERKGCDWLLANDVSNGNIFGKDNTQILLLPQQQKWQGTKTQIAENLTAEIIKHFEQTSQKESA